MFFILIKTFSRGKKNNFFFPPTSFHFLLGSHQHSTRSTPLEIQGGIIRFKIRKPPLLSVVVIQQILFSLENPVHNDSKLSSLAAVWLFHAQLFQSLCLLPEKIPSILDYSPLNLSVPAPEHRWNFVSIKRSWCFPDFFIIPRRNSSFFYLLDESPQARPSHGSWAWTSWIGAKRNRDKTNSHWEFLPRLELKNLDYSLEMI